MQQPPRSQRRSRNPFRWKAKISSSLKRKGHEAEAATPSIQASAVAFDNPEVLDKVFGLVGKGHYFFCASVSRAFRGRYLSFSYQTAASEKDDKLITYYSSTLTSASRLELALSAGVAMTESDRLGQEQELLQQSSTACIAPDPGTSTSVRHALA